MLGKESLTGAGTEVGDRWVDALCWGTKAQGSMESREGRKGIEIFEAGRWVEGGRGGPVEK